MGFLDLQLYSGGCVRSGCTNEAGKKVTSPYVENGRSLCLFVILEESMLGNLLTFNRSIAQLHCGYCAKLLLDGDDLL